MKDNYELLWDIPSNDGYLQLSRYHAENLLTKLFLPNTNYDPNKFEGGKVPMKVLLKDLLERLQIGGQNVVLP